MKPFRVLSLILLVHAVLWAAIVFTGPTAHAQLVGDLAVQRTAAFLGDITPTQLTADQNDYSPTSLSTASVLRLSSNATRTITGLAGGSDGRVLVLHNVGSFSIILSNASASSTAANRFLLMANYTIAANGSVILQYDATASRWRMLSQIDTASTYQPLDSDLTAIAALSTTSFGRSVLALADAAASRTLFGLVIGTNVQAYDADLTTYAGIPPSVNVQNILAAADYAAIRTLLGLTIGTNVQAYDADLTTYAGITPSANVQTLLGAANYAAFRTSLGLAIGTNVQAWDTDLDTWATKTAPSGTAVGTTDTQTLTNKSLSGATNTLTAIPLTTAVTGVLPAANGGTGVANSSTLTLGGNVTFANPFTTTFTVTGTTALTLPTTGTLATLAGSEALSNKTLTASAFNGTVGATTPGTGAFTTLSASGPVTGTATASLSQGAFLASSSDPSYRFFSSGAGANLKNWDINAGAGNLRFRVFDDALSTVTVVATLSTTGLAVTGATSSYSYAGAGGGLTIANTDDVSGTVFAAFRLTTGEIGSIARVGATSAVVYNTSSDRRLKTRIRDFTDSGALIDALQPRLFDWKSGGTDTLGFIAQEVNAASPLFAKAGAVTVGDDDPETISKQWQMDPAKLVPVLTAELKSLRARVAALEAADKSNRDALLLVHSAACRGYIAIPIALLAFVVAARRKK